MPVAFWTVIILFVLCCLARMTGVYHHTQISIDQDGSLTNCLPRLAWNHNLFSLHLPSSWYYRLEPRHLA
jgi:hypothetical protein